VTAVVFGSHCGGVDRLVAGLSCLFGGLWLQFWEQQHRSSYIFEAAASARTEGT